MCAHLWFAVFYLSLLSYVKPNAEVMRIGMLHYVRPLVKCQREMSLPDSIYTDFLNFWNEDYVFTSHPTGCAIICIAAKQNLIIPGEKSRLDLKNLFNLLKRSGADEETAHKILYFLHKCEQTVHNESDGCLKAIKSANCFRKDIHNNKWNPHFHGPWMTP